MPGTPDHAVLHQAASGEWEEIPARYSGGFLYGYSRDASPFREREAQLAAASSDPDRHVFRGWIHGLATVALLEPTVLG